LELHLTPDLIHLRKRYNTGRKPFSPFISIMINMIVTAILGDYWSFSWDEAMWSDSSVFS